MNTKKFLSLLLAILMCFSCFSMISFAETTESGHLTTVPEGYVGIYTKDDLDNIKLDLSGKYLLMNDIVFTEEDYSEGGSFYNSGKGWSPIGTKDYPFNGTFDGNSYSIINIQINNPNGDYQGLFGYATNSTITNVILEASNIIGDTYVGGLLGYSKYCLITNCINFATITGQDEVAGIAGYDFYSEKANNNGFYRCINAGDITAKNGGAAGIVGYCYKNYHSYTDISYCFNIGNIRSSISSYGIASNAANIIQSYSIGNIKGANSYPNYPIGYADNSIKACYYLDTSITTPPYGGGTAKSKDQMTKQTTYEGWDFDTIWTMEGREDYPYPELREVPLVLPDDKKTEISAEINIVGDGKVGSVLSADIKNLTPENATYSYEWTVGNTVVSTEETYTVAQADANKDIILTIKGNGDFKGKISSEAITGICIHNAEEYTYNNDATCTKNGTNTATCLLCGEKFTVEAENTIVSHTFENYIYQNDATCKNDGTSVAKCEYCDATDSKTADGTKTGHSFSEAWIIDKEATCAEEGIKSHHCKNCDAKTDETVLKKLAHEHSTTVTNATCSENGKIVYTCICGDSYSEIIYASGHIDNDGDANCDSCYEPIETEEDNEPECKCICHETGIVSILYKILVTVQRYFKVDLLGKVFKMGRLCECGEAHY